MSFQRFDWPMFSRAKTVNMAPGFGEVAEEQSMTFVLQFLASKATTISSRKHSRLKLLSLIGIPAKKREKSGKKSLLHEAR